MVAALGRDQKAALVQAFGQYTFRNRERLTLLAGKLLSDGVRHVRFQEEITITVQPANAPASALVLSAVLTARMRIPTPNLVVLGKVPAGGIRDVREATRDGRGQQLGESTCRFS
jgi:hypothetical protein